MSAREDDARRFAEKMGWTYFRHPSPSHAEEFGFEETPEQPTGSLLWCPMADAPLSTHLAFIGRVAEALPGAELTDIIRVGPPLAVDYGWRVVLQDDDHLHLGDASDLSWAALLAAIAAREASR